MKHAYRSLLLFALPLLSFVPDSWITAPIDKQLTVEVPAQLQEVDMKKIDPSAKGYRLFMASDTIAVYQVITSSVPKGSNVEPGRSQYLEGAIKGFVEASEGSLLSRTTFQTTGGEGLEFSFRAPNPSSHQSTINKVRMIIVGNTGYVFNFIPVDQKDSTGTVGQEQRHRFFSSIQVKTAKK